MTVWAAADLLLRAAALGERLEQPLQRVEPRSAAVAEPALLHGLDDGAVRGIRKMRAPARALLGDLGEVGERLEDVRRVDVAQPERADAGGVDDPPRAALAAIPERDRRARGVPAA